MYNYIKKRKKQAKIKVTVKEKSTNTSTVPSGTNSIDKSVTVEKNAVVSKVEENTIYIENNSYLLQLTENAEIVEIVNGVEKNIAVNEILSGDEIVIYYTGLTAEVYPSFVAGCEKIVVESSEKAS